MNSTEVELYRQNFLSWYANKYYAKFQAVRQQVGNCACESAVMKGIGDDDNYSKVRFINQFSVHAGKPFYPKMVF